MAIIDSLPGVEVTVVVGGQPLQEHIDAELPNSTDIISRRIEAASDQDFEIHIRAKKGMTLNGDCLAARVYVDGTQTNSILWDKDRIQQSDRSVVFKGRDNSRDCVESFYFSAIDFESEKPLLSDELERLQSVGTIRVTFEHGRKVEIASSSTGRRGESENDLGVVSKKALLKTSLSHSVGFRPAITEPASSTGATSTTSTTTTWWITANVDPTGKPAGTFVFHYNSRQTLQYMNLIPRSPSPTPVEDKEHPTPEDVKRMQQEMKAMKAKEARRLEIKQEQEEDNPRPRKKARPSPGATILQLDDDGGVEALTPAPSDRREREVIVLDDD